MLKPLGGEIIAISEHPPGLVADAPRTANTPHTITVQTPLGARSEARFTHDGGVEVRFTGKPDVGTRGEARVRDTLLEKLRSEGRDAHYVDGAENHRGEDGRLLIGGRPFNLQVTTVPADRDFWGQASRSSSLTRVEAEAAVAWIRKAVVAKSTLDGRETTILALDAQHAGVLSDEGIADVYRKTFGSPSQEFRFAQSWIVGPTASHCTQL
jgi:hypothetical protein